MNVNLNTIDRVVRFLLFLISIILFLLGVTSGWFAYLLVIAGTIFLLTSLMSFCPIYWVFGLSSNRKSSETDKESVEETVEETIEETVEETID
mgnify:FL=1